MRTELFRHNLQKIASFNQQQIRAQGAQLVQQGQLMMTNPLGAMAHINQQARVLSNNPNVKPQQATQMAALLHSTQPTMSKVAAMAFINELEETYGYELDEQTKEAMFGAAAKLIGQGLNAGVGAIKTVAANPMLAANNAAMKVMTAPGMQTMMHNPALGTALMGQQLAGGVGQALLGKGLSGAVQGGAKMLPGAVGANVNAFGSMLGHVV
jgi:hypothetical protein